MRRRISRVSLVTLLVAAGGACGGPQTDAGSSEVLAVLAEGSADLAQIFAEATEREGSAGAESAPEGSADATAEGSASQDAVLIELPVEAVPVETAEDRWRFAMTECPSLERGSLADVWQWPPLNGEIALSQLDIEGDGTTFDLLADYEGTSIIVRVRDAETTDSVAVIKTTSSNTRVGAEIYAYRLANFAGFGHLVPPVMPVELEQGAVEKMRDLLASTRYDDANKESNRQRVVARLDEALDSGEVFHAAMKPWLRAFMFDHELGNRETLATHPVMEFLRHGEEQPSEETFVISQFTRLYSPRGTHRGTIPMWALAEDMSNLLLMDALMGQNDRFAGANVHFRSVDGTSFEDGERNGAPIWNLGDVRILALDNGAAMRGENGSGIGDLRGSNVRGTRVERFERESVERVRALGRRALGYGCEVPAFPDEAEAIWAYLGATGDEAARAAGYLENVLEYLDELEDDYGDDIYLAPLISAPTPPEVEGSGGAA